MSYIRHPSIEPTRYRLAVIGAGPREEDHFTKQPFSGTGGNLLRACLANTGLANDSVLFAYLGDALLPALSAFKPHCLLLLGDEPLSYFRGDGPSLSDYRGSIFLGRGFKCVATYAPEFIFQAYSEIPFFRLDINRAKQQSEFSEIRSAVRTGNLTPSLSDAIAFMQDVRAKQTPVSFDIEGYADDVGVTMLSICPTPTSGIVIPLAHRRLDDPSYWTEDEEIVIWRELSALLADPNVPKDAHNAFYELFVFGWRHKTIINNLANDTMMKHWENYPEMPRALGVAASIYTEEPYYKDERKTTDPTIKLNYNFKDSAVTKEISDVLEKKLLSIPKSYEHYRFNISLIPAVNYIMLRGCRFDVNKAQQLKAETQAEVDDLNAQIQSTLGREFNVKSVPDKQWLLYEHFGFKESARYGRSTKEDILLKHWAKTRDPLLRNVIRCTRKRTRVSDINKLVCNDDGRIRTSIDLVGTNTGRVSSRNSIAMRLAYKKSGEAYWDETGTNLQNVTKDLRICFLPDAPEIDFWQFDLAGADGWTVAADLAAIGHSTMLDDYLAGIKPALVLMAMLRAYEAKEDVSKINNLSRADLKALCRSIKADLDANEGKKDSLGRDYGWKYFACKCVQHGSNYGGQNKTIAEIIFRESDGEVDITDSEAGIYQYFYKLRYKTDARNDRIKKELQQYGHLTAACGIRRQFFGIRNKNLIDDATVREASSFEPQANTTWATNKALQRLWYDEVNRKSSGALHVEPLLQIHDALAGQYHSRARLWAHDKLREWFTNPLMIHKQIILIPAEGNYGTSWKDTINRI